MAAGIAHEIRNPLASMSGSIQILRQELPLSAEQEQLMDIVLRESDRLNDDDPIVSRLCAAAALRRSPASTSAARSTTRRALLRNSADVHDRHLIDVDVPPQELWYEADEGQIKQIVWNLATNGLRAMPDGGRLRLTAALRAGLERRRHHRAGRGDRHSARGARMVSSSPSTAASPRAPASGSPSFTASSPTINGEIQVSSQPGRGTTVSVRLPEQRSPCVTT